MRTTSIFNYRRDIPPDQPHPTTGGITQTTFRGAVYLWGILDQKTPTLSKCGPFVLPW